MALKIDGSEKLIQYADCCQVKAKDIAAATGVSKDVLLRNLEGNSYTLEELQEFVNIIDQIASDRIISKRQQEPAKKKAAAIPKERYKAHRKHNDDIISYMLSHGVTLTELTRKIGYLHLSDLMKKKALTQDQALEVITAIDEITKTRKGDKVDVWGRPIYTNKDIRHLLHDNRITIRAIALFMGVTEEGFRNEMQEELSAEKKDRIREAVGEYNFTRKEYALFYPKKKEEERDHI